MSYGYWCNLKDVVQNYLSKIGDPKMSLYRGSTISVELWSIINAVCWMLIESVHLIRPQITRSNRNPLMLGDNYIHLHYCPFKCLLKSFLKLCLSVFSSNRMWLLSSNSSYNKKLSNKYFSSNIFMYCNIR